MTQTELHLAARFGDLKKVMDLVENKGFNVEEKDDDNGSTPLHYAAEIGYVEVVRYLVEQARVDVDAKNNHGYTPLHFAAYYGYLDVVRYLVEQVRVDLWITNNDGQTASDFTYKRETKEYLKNMMEDGEGGLTMTKSAAFNPSKKNKIDHEGRQCDIK